jgi:hypothetical protein
MKNKTLVEPFQALKGTLPTLPIFRKFSCKMDMSYYLGQLQAIWFMIHGKHFNEKYLKKIKLAACFQKKMHFKHIYSTTNSKLV